MPSSGSPGYLCRETASLGAVPVISNDQSSLPWPCQPCVRRTLPRLGVPLRVGHTATSAHEAPSSFRLTRSPPPPRRVRATVRRGRASTPHPSTAWPRGTGLALLRSLPAPGPEGQGPGLLRKPVYTKPALDPGALGELGRAVRLELSPAEKRLQEESVRQHQINTYLSDRISLHRRLPDRWHPLCREKKYDYYSLPKTSVVIAFYNEAWSTLLRTVHSVLETSPDILLEEIILVDDYSDKEHLKESLENYVAGLRKVRLIRANKREGLVRARLLGASVAKGDILTFLDCHCECHEGWLEPLLARIAEEESAVVCPVIDVIDWNTFEYLGNAGEPQIGGFDWRLVFTWHSTPEREQKRRKSKTDSLDSYRQTPTDAYQHTERL
uniref:Polypeptide N-acetylgalactosaminyltransferase 12 n=1 Tax=Strix occidentalis caurina TaxID=311401 RepID=A0A8D0EUM7_STROC